MEFSKKMAGNNLEIEIMGGIDNDSSEELKNYFMEVLDSEFEQVHVDLFNVPFITSSGEAVKCTGPPAVSFW